MATSGKINGTTKNSSGTTLSYYGTWIDWKVNSTSVANNTSNITVSVKVQRTDGYTGTTAHNLEDKPSTNLYVGGVIQVVTENYLDTRNLKVCTLATWTGNVKHNDDGTLSLPISCNWYVPNVSALETGSISGTAVLNTIPRASTFGSVSGNTIGERCIVTLNVSSSSFTHRMWYKVGNSDWYDLGTLSAGSDAVSFIIAEETVNQLSTATSGTMQLCVRTMNGTTQVGSDVYKDVTVYVPDYNNENIQITFWGIKLLNGILVEGKSFLSVNMIVSADPGASIVSCVSAIDGKEYHDTTFDTSPLSAGYHSIRVTAVDSRGKTYTASSDAVYVEPYGKPSISILTAERDSDTPTTVYVEYKGSVSWLNGQNTISAKVTLNGETKTIPTNNASASGTVTFYNVPTDNSLTVTGEITDYYTTEYKEVVLGTTSVTMDFYSTGKGIAIGKVAEGEGLEVDWKSTFNKQTIHDGGMVCNNGVTINNKLISDFVIYKQHSGVDTHVDSAQNFAGITFKNFNNTGSNILGRIGMNDANGLKRFANSGAEYLVLDTSNIGSYLTSAIDDNRDVEYGTNSSWNYEKLDNGVLKLYRNFSVSNVAVTSPWGALYSSPQITLPTFPTTTGLKFTETPQVHLCWNGSYSAILDGATGVSTTKCGYVYIFRPDSVTLSSGSIAIQVIGKWK